MKKILGICLSMGFFALTNAQSVITSALLPTPGKVQFLFRDTVAKKTKVGSVPTNTGSLQTWDFTFLTANFKDTTVFTAPNGTKSQAAYPQATVYGLNRGTNTAYLINGNVYGVLGSYNGPTGYYNRTSNDNAPYIFRKLHLPLTYLDSYRDTQAYNTIQNDQALMGSLKFYGYNVDSIRTKHYEIRIVSCDGFGKVLLPNGVVFSKTLRVKDSVQRKDSTEFYRNGKWGGVPPQLANFFAPVSDTTKTIVWYADSTGFPFPAVTVNYTKDRKLGNITYLNPIPAPIVINFDAQDVRCYGESNGMVTANVSGGSGSYVYLWSNGVTTASNNNVKMGKYTITVTDAVTGSFISKSATILEPDAIALTAKHKNPSGGVPDDGEAYLDATGGNQINIAFFGPAYSFTFHWSTDTIRNKSGDPLSDTLTGLKAGTYYVTVTDIKGCSASTSYVLINANGSGVSSLAKEQLNSLYPNPFSTGVQVGFEIKRAQPVTIKIVNTTGQTVMDIVKNKVMPAGKYDEIYDLSDLPVGIFFLHIEKDGVWETRKLIHQK